MWTYGSNDISIPQRICQQTFDSILGSTGEYNTRQIIKPFELDLYYKNYNLAIEYCGKGWHSNEDAIRRDKAKIEKCKEKNINLIVIKETSRRYEEDVKEQVIESLNIINDATGLNITSQNVNDIQINYKKVYDAELKIDEIKLAISKCKNIAEFQKKHYNYYNIIHKTGMINLLDSIRTVFIRTNEELFKICSEIKYYKDFLKYHSDIYSICHKKGILKDTTKHMIKTKNSLKLEQVIEIKNLLLNNKINYSKIACAFNVNPSTIKSIHSGRTWKHVKI